MKSKILFCLILPLVLLTMGSCKGDKAAIPENEIHCMLSPELQPLMLGLAKQFLEPNPSFKLRLIDQRSDMLTTLDSGNISMFIISGDTTAYSGKGLEFHELAMQAVLTVFSYEHPDIAVLARQGAKKTGIAAAFDGSIKDWSELGADLGSHPIRPYTIDLSQEISRNYFAYLGTEPTASMNVGNAAEMKLKLRQDTFGLGYLNSSELFDPGTGFRSVGLYVLPLDQDSSGFIEDREHIYDDIRIFSQALSAGLYPESLIRRYYIAVPETGRNKATEEFLKWLDKEGTAACRALSYSRSAGN